MWKGRVPRGPGIPNFFGIHPQDITHSVAAVEHRETAPTILKWVLLSLTLTDLSKSFYTNRMLTSVAPFAIFLRRWCTTDDDDDDDDDGDARELATCCRTGPATRSTTPRRRTRRRRLGRPPGQLQRPPSTPPWRQFRPPSSTRCRRPSTVPAAPNRWCSCKAAVPRRRLANSKSRG